MAADADSVRLARLCSGLRQSRGLAGKRDIAHALAALGDTTVPGAPAVANGCLLYTSPSPRDGLLSRMPSSA